MKRVLITYLVTFFVLNLSFCKVFATIRRVSYPGTSLSGVDYYSLQYAIDASSSNDTVLVFPSLSLWTATLNKPLVILGNGYQYTGNVSFSDPSKDISNTGLQTLTGRSLISSITLGSYSDGSTLSGLIIDGSPGVININNSSNNTITRNYFYDDSKIYIDGTTSNNAVIGNYFSYSIDIEINYNSTTESTSGLRINNNIFTGAGSNYIKQNGLGLTGEIANNDFGDPFYNTTNSIAFYLTFPNANITFKNNILQYVYFINSHNNCTFYNNVSDTTGLFINEYQNTWIPNDGITSISNQFLHGLTTVYTLDATVAPDKRLALAAGSPAKGTGLNGVDCGAYGGPTPYKLSGIPSIPTVYNITGPSTRQTNGNTLNLTIKTRTNN